MIRNLGSLYSFVQESIQSKISKSTLTKAISVKKRLLETPDPQIGSIVIAATETNNGKSSRQTLEFGQERLQTSERRNNDNNDNLDQYLNKDNLPLGDLQVNKVVYKMSS